MNKKKLPKKISVFLFLIIFSSENFFSQTALYQTDLSTLSPSWQTVIGGEIVAPPAETSYGFAAVTDGRMISAFTQKGVILWQKSIKGKSERFFSSWNDFLIAVTDKSVLNFINPGGTFLWSVDCGFEITQNPFVGRDGRIFVQGKKNIACYGLKGSQKWKLELKENAVFSTSGLPDGSLVFFFEQTDDGKTHGFRLSPFGEVLEEITFAGKITAKSSCADGILMAFEDGSAGLFAENKNNSVSKWVLKSETQNSPIKKIICGQKTSALLYNKGTELKIKTVENSTGRLISEFSGGIMSLFDTVFLRPTDRGFFISSSFKAIEFDENGNIFWEAKLPSKATWNFITYTSSNQLFLCMKNWVLNAFVMSQSVGNKKIVSQTKKTYTVPSKNIQSFDGIVYSPVPLSRIEEIQAAFQKKDFFQKEKTMTEELQELSQSYLSELFEKNRNPHEDKSFYSNNPIYTQKFLEAMSYSESDIFVSDFANFLELEEDPFLLDILVQTSANSGYDESGQILKAYELVIEKKLQKKDVKLAKLLCDSTYKIVAFMGRPALYRQGKQILSNFMTDRFDRQVRSYAGETFTKILKLEL